MRLIEPQDCPCQPKFIPPTLHAATFSGSASAKAISGFLPPNSSVTSFTAVSAAAFWIAMPDGGWPIKAIRLTRGMAHQCLARFAPAGDDVDHSRRQDLLADFAKDGCTRVDSVPTASPQWYCPEMIAGAMREAANPIGWLNGMMRPITP